MVQLKLRTPEAALRLSALWCAITLLTATQWQLINQTYGLHKFWLTYLMPALIANMLWAYLTPIATTLAGRFPL